jgi:hypothetical protein
VSQVSRAIPHASFTLLDWLDQKALQTAPVLPHERALPLAGQVVGYHDTMQQQVISVEAAIQITERSRSTWWRRMSKGEATRVADDGRGRAMLLWDEVLPQLCLPLAPEEAELALSADAGNAAAQNDIGQLFLARGKPKVAVYWFEQAAAQNHADAMQWLGHCYISGLGVTQDHHLGMMWLSKAAAHGHVIARELMRGLMRFDPQP